MVFPIIQFVFPEDDDLGNFLTFPIFTNQQISNVDVSYIQNFKLEETDVVVYLGGSTSVAVSNATVTIHRRDTAANYQTPAAGTIPIAVIIVQNGANTTAKIIEMLTNDTADSDATEAIQDTLADLGGLNSEHGTLVGRDLPNSKFLSIKNSAASPFSMLSGFVVERP